MTYREPADRERKQQTSNRLLERFRNEFTFKLAQDDATRKRVFRLRYDVYCAELGYEHPENPSHHQEHDAHDAHAIQCLVEHRKSGLAAGCVRLVLPKSREEGGGQTLPLQEYGGNSLNHETLHPSRFCQRSICEISRLAISPLFRKRSTREEIASIVLTNHAFTEAERETFPLIVIGLFLATYALLGLSKRPHAFAMMDPRLPRLLKMSGFYFTKVGETIEFHGKRSAFYIDQRQVEKDMHAELMPLYQHIKATLAPQIEGALPNVAAESTY
ncbi:PEP-CTERM/exosortase system-associated acyltransferase [Halomonas stenophila]|uniref:N-acyl amino acid synthase of PEP-CTERM/exosortase system n=1 Tax=Halomonas stenophila TaxID=795312 RepID=A0A7W5HLM0_9GAMM|nr:PEP-CTERM/exosortase system-associated acyltransferase [Halomonas stenophila]MBB3231253.1 N-acyl amino acid synthase of PEP-CTERM/exosortase system [Halomonas stenophila]